MEANELAEHVREALAGHGDAREVRMFGGLCFMLDGNMAVGASPRGLLVRVGKEKHAEAVSRPGARTMEMRGRPMPGYVVVDVGGLDYRSLREWVALARAYVSSLPPKASASNPKRPKKGRG